MLETSARLLELLSLFQAQRCWSGIRLCERLGVTARTLRRDVDRLRRLGYPVDSSSGTAGGYKLGQGATVPPLLLDDEEAVAAAVGLRTAASGTVTGMEEASLRALSKLEQVLPQRLRHRVAALHSFILPLANHGPAVDPGTLSALAAACRDCESLGFIYRKRDVTESQRQVQPHRLVHTGRRWYLIAWDTERNDWRTFRVDRIGPRLQPGPRFTPREAPEGDFAAYVAKSVSYSPYPHRAKVTLFTSIETASQRLPPCAGTLKAVDNETCVLLTEASSLDMLAVHLALTGFEFQVHEPPELIERIRALAARFGRAVSLPAPAEKAL